MTSKEIKTYLTDYYLSMVTQYKVFEEVKTGNTWSDGTKLYKIDFLAYKVGWKTSELLGFEIKVSRSDFLRNKKWHNYKEFVNKLSFACPENLIKKSELPENIGLVYIKKDGKVKWVRRPNVINKVPNPSIFQYLVNSRI